MSEKQDLRVTRTLQAIRRALYDMILEEEYHDITIKELSRRAMINRNTFYLHFPSVDALMEALENEIAEDFASMYVSYDNIEDIKEMIRRFLLYLASRSPLMERIFLCDSYRFVAQNIHTRLIARRDQMRHGQFGVSKPAEDLILSYCGSAAISLYRHWVVNGKKLSVEELVSLSTTLIGHGMERVLGR